MKKLMLAPFLLASLFSFGGELKAYPNSHDKLPNQRSSLSESQSNSKEVWYLLHQNTIQWKGFNQWPGNEGFSFKGWSTVTFDKLKISTFANRTICNRFANNKRIWINQIDLGKFEEIDFRYKPYTKCLKGVDENGSNYALEISSIKMKKEKDRNNNISEYIIHTLDGYDQVADDLSSFNTIYFRGITECRLAKSKLDSWFRTLKNKFLSNSKLFIRYSTKCINKT